MRSEYEYRVIHLFWNFLIWGSLDYFETKKTVVIYIVRNYGNWKKLKVLSIPIEMFLIKNFFACTLFAYLIISYTAYLSTSAASTYSGRGQDVTSEPNRNERKHIVRRDTLVTFPNNRVLRSKYDNSSEMYKPKLLLRLIR